jgi:hypothetical protein
LSENKTAAAAALFEEVYHYYQNHDVLERFCNGRIRPGDPFYRQANLFSINGQYMPNSNPRAYLNSPIEAYAKKFARYLVEKAFGPCTANEIAGMYDSKYGPIQCTASGTTLRCLYGDRLSKSLNLELKKNGTLLDGIWKWEPETGQSGSVQFDVTKTCGLGNGRWRYGFRPWNSWPVDVKESH